MKSSSFIIATLGLILAWFPIQAFGDELIFSGTVVGISPQNGTIVMADSPGTHFTFTGLDRARIETANGKITTLSELRPGMRISIAYVVQGDRWLISRLPLPAVIPTEPAVVDKRYKTLFDGDITTKPGSKAAVDNDITTKPDGIADRDGDITTKAPHTANKDGDITTKED